MGFSNADAVTPRALRFLILAACRTSEALNATWSEIDLKERVWSIPGERMKAGREHRVLLSSEAAAILAAIKPKDANPAAWVFLGAREGKPESNMALLKLMERNGQGDLTAHGFRSSFRDWAAEHQFRARSCRNGASARAQ